MGIVTFDPKVKRLHLSLYIIAFKDIGLELLILVYNLHDFSFTSGEIIIKPLLCTGN